MVSMMLNDNRLDDLSRDTPRITMETESLIAQSFELVNDTDYICSINSIKSPKLDTQIIFNLLKRRENHMSDIITIRDVLRKIKEKN